MAKAAIRLPAGQQQLLTVSAQPVAFELREVRSWEEALAQIVQVNTLGEAVLSEL